MFGNSRIEIDSTNNCPFLNNIFQFAEQAVNTIGIDFTPSPSQMDSLITLKFSAEMQQKSRLFVFDDDDLDSSVSLLNSLSNQAEYDSKDLEVSRLKGTHSLNSFAF